MLRISSLASFLGTALLSLLLLGNTQAQTVVDIALSDPAQFSTLAVALATAGLAGELGGDGPFTVFAPTNEAFTASVDPLTLAGLLGPDGHDDLQKLLLYHVVPGKVVASDLEDGAMVETLNGATIAVSLTEDGGVMINDATVTSADIDASNGVIHIIDRVLIPPEESDAETMDDGGEDMDMMKPEMDGDMMMGGNETMMEEEKPMMDDEPPTSNIVELAVATDALSTLVELVTLAELAETLQGEGPFTVFAPTNDAFAELDPDTVDALKADPSGDLTSILLYHVVPGKVMSSDLVDGAMVETLNGASVKVTITSDDDGTSVVMVDDDEVGGEVDGEVDIVASKSGHGGTTTVMINDAKVIIPDILAINGVVHVIDKVLIPPAAGEEMEELPAPDDEDDMGEMDPDMEGDKEEDMMMEETAMNTTIVDLAVATEDLSTLVSLVTLADLADTLAGEGPFTVFAPTNSAFGDLDPETVTALTDDPSGALTPVLLYHVAGAKVLSSDLKDGAMVETLNGSTLKVTIGEDGSVMINDAKVVTADVMASNGVVHIIDKVLIPPAAATDGEGGEMEDTMEDEEADEDGEADEEEQDEEVEEVTEEEEEQPTILDIAEVDEQLTDFVELLSIADLLSKFASAENTFTVFAPTNSAIELDLDPNFVEAVRRDPNLASFVTNNPDITLEDLLLYHVVPGAYLSTDLEDGMTLDTVYGPPLTIAIDGDEVMINGEATVITANVGASNGVIHVIDQVLIPPEDYEAPEDEPEDAEVEEEDSPEPVDEDEDDSSDEDEDEAPEDMEAGGDAAEDDTGDADVIIVGTIENVGNGGEPADVFPLAACKGDCDDDDECGEGLTCKDRNSASDEVSIYCSGEPDPVEAIDYCVPINPPSPEDALDMSGSDGEDAEEEGDKPGFQDGEPIIFGVLGFVANDELPAYLFPLQMCKGDCDKDEDCVQGAGCLQRDGPEDPGSIHCDGDPDPTTDYCVPLFELYPDEEDPQQKPEGWVPPGEEPEEDTAPDFEVTEPEDSPEPDEEGEDGGEGDELADEADMDVEAGGDAEEAGGEEFEEEVAGGDDEPGFIDGEPIIFGVLGFVANDEVPEYLFPLPMCKGDCDKDEDCVEGAGCLQREGPADPGSIHCDGDPDPTTDYCIPLFELYPDEEDPQQKPEFWTPPEEPEEDAAPDFEVTEPEDSPEPAEDGEGDGAEDEAADEADMDVEAGGDAEEEVEQDADADEGEEDQEIEEVTEEEGEPPSIVDITEVSDQLSDWLELLSIADLITDFQASEDVFTIFAPTNTAIELDLDPEFVEAVEFDPNLASFVTNNPDITLKDLLNFHIVPGQMLLSTDLEDGMVLETAYGPSLTISVSDDGTVTINDQATVITPDAVASNGVLHLIDHVLIPPESEGGLLSEEQAEDEDMDDGDENEMDEMTDEGDGDDGGDDGDDGGDDGGDEEPAGDFLGIIENVGNGGEPADVFPLAVCKGDCDDDDECAEGLKCKQRNKPEEEVSPNCGGEPDPEEGVDYCVPADEIP